MSTNKFVTLVDGIRRLATAIASSSGIPDANKIVATGSGGYLDRSLLPPSVVTTVNGFIPSGQLPANLGERTDTVTASEALSAGNFINYWVDNGTRKVRKADATNNRPAHGFVLSAVAIGGTATVYLEGRNTSLSNLTAGVIHFLATGGNTSTTAPAIDATGQIVQELGFAYDATALSFEYDGYTVIA